MMMMMMMMLLLLMMMMMVLLLLVTLTSLPGRRGDTWPEATAKGELVCVRLCACGYCVCSVRVDTACLSLRVFMYLLWV